MADLSLQQRLDRRRRQGVVAKLPVSIKFKAIFPPPSKIFYEDFSVLRPIIYSREDISEGRKS